MVNGVEREFFDYIARGAPFGPDDGTVAPWVVVASLPFAPEIVIPTVRNFARMDLGMTGKYGFKPSFNQIVCRAGQPDRLVGHAVSLRHRSGAGRADDRKLPDRTALEHHAPLPGGRHRTAAGGIQRRLAVATVERLATGRSLLNAMRWPHRPARLSAAPREPESTPQKLWSSVGA